MLKEMSAPTKYYHAGKVKSINLLLSVFPSRFGCSVERNNNAINEKLHGSPLKEI